MDRALINEKVQKLLNLKSKLKKSDYKTLKFLEGDLSTSEYQASVAERKAWREEINVLQAEIKALTSQTT